MATQYIISGTLKHDGQIYTSGSAFSTEDAALEQQLRKTGTILLPEEYAAAAAASGDSVMLQQLADERARLAQENAAKDAELARLRALVEDKSGEEASSESATEPSESASGDSEADAE